MNMENIFKDIMKSVYAELKPLGYKKDGQNFRLFQEDGLCKIINFQRDRWNTKELRRIISRVIKGEIKWMKLSKN